MKAVLDTNVPISSVIATGVPHDDVVKYFSKLQAVSPLLQGAAEGGE
ncbi:hypothetical protein [Halobacterium sp. KA-4]|nr:hypothetical protein [Halobacterium sp. KA-4]